MLFNSYINGSNEYLGRLYLIVSSLIGFGLVALYSISNDPTSLNSSFFRQIIFVVFSFFVFLIIQKVNVIFNHTKSECKINS